MRLILEVIACRNESEEIWEIKVGRRKDQTKEVVKIGFPIHRNGPRVSTRNSSSYQRTPQWRKLESPGGRNFRSSLQIKTNF